MSWGTHCAHPKKRSSLRGKNWRNLQNKLVFICEVGKWTQKTPISMNTSWKQEQVASIQNSDLCERFQLGQAQLRLPYWLPLIFIVTHASPFCPLPVPIGIICSRSATNAADTFSNKIWPAECQIWHDFKQYFCNYILYKHCDLQNVVHFWTISSILGSIYNLFVSQNVYIINVQTYHLGCWSQRLGYVTPKIYISDNILTIIFCISWTLKVNQNIVFRFSTISLAYGCTWWFPKLVVLQILHSNTIHSMEIRLAPPVPFCPGSCPVCSPARWSLDHRSLQKWTNSPHAETTCGHCSPKTKYARCSWCSWHWENRGNHWNPRWIRAIWRWFAGIIILPPGATQLPKPSPSNSIWTGSHRNTTGAFRFVMGVPPKSPVIIHKLDGFSMK